MLHKCVRVLCEDVDVYILQREHKDVGCSMYDDLVHGSSFSIITLCALVHLMFPTQGFSSADLGPEVNRLDANEPNVSDDWTPASIHNLALTPE